VGVQVLIDRAHGAARLGLTRVRVRPGSHTEAAILRRREEAWLIIQGVGCFRQAAEDGTGEAATTLRHGDSVFVPPDYTHWIESIGAEDLVFLRCTAPPEHPQAPKTSSQGEQHMADRYEYKILVSDSDDETDEETLNGLGDQGWELVNAVADVRAGEEDGGDSADDQNVPVTVFYFKRVKE
jgi:mannose-6-phosphate isomerase-like protein (cupin superfamily)